MRACGQCVSYGTGAGMRDHGRCVALEGVLLPMWVDLARREGHGIVHVNLDADSCAAYCQMVRPIGAPENWSTPYERWLDEHKEG